MQTNTEKNIKIEFVKYLYDVTVKNLTIKLILGLVFLFFFAYSDLIIRDNYQAFCTRLLSISIALPLLVFHIFTKKRFHHLKAKMFNILLASTLIMVYSNYLVYAHQQIETISSIGIILVIFLVSIDLRTTLLNSILVLGGTFAAFIIIFLLYFNITEKDYTNITNVIPILIIGFTVNQIQNKLRYDRFKADLLLNQEREKTEDLYKETLTMNEDLHEKNVEITAQRDEIQNKKDELEIANATKDRFLSILAHDLRTPFNSILGFSDLLYNNIEEYEKQKIKTYAQNINNVTLHTYNLLNNLLEWSLSQQDKQPLKPEILNLNKLVNSTYVFIEEIASAKLISIDIEIPEQYMIEADKNMLTTILRNIVSNAIKYTSENGQIKIVAQQKSENIQIEISDNGVGMSEQTKESLFKISKIKSLEGTNGERGSGFGLLLCKEFIDKHNGQVNIESKIGEGSKFTITLPVRNSL